MSVYKRSGSPYYYAEFQVNGVRFLRSTKKTTEREAKAEERRLKAEARAALQKQASASRLTLDQAFGKYWIEHAERTLSPTWRAEVWRYSQQIITTVSPDMLVEDVDEAVIDQFVQTRLAQGAGPYAINRALAVWRRVHNLCRKRWRQRTHEIDWSEFLRKEHKRVRALTIAEAHALLDGLHPDLAWPIRWSLLTGTRRSATYSLKWDDIDFVQRKAVVREKGGKEHIVWLSDAAIALLQEIPRRGRYVFRHGNRRKEFARALERAGIKDFRWHDLRHTFATWMRQGGVPLEVVQRALGHVALATTERYAHVMDSEVLEAMQRLPSLSPSPPKILSLRRARSKG